MNTSIIETLRAHPSAIISILLSFFFLSANIELPRLSVADDKKRKASRYLAGAVFFIMTHMVFTVLSECTASKERIIFLARLQWLVSLAPGPMV